MPILTADINDIDTKTIDRYWYRDFKPCLKQEH